MIKGFKDFLLRGNVVDLAVAVVIGTAFATVVKAFTDGIIKPILTAAGSAGSSGFGPTLRAGNRATLVDIGALLAAAINFVMVAAVVYFVIEVPMTRLRTLRKEGIEPEPTAPAEDILLLQEIRDLLKAQRG